MITIFFAVVLTLFFAFAQYWGLVQAPPDQLMGDVYRILFVHVPAAWNAFVLFFISFVACIVYLIRGKSAWDRLAHGAIEIGVVLTGLALALGSIWGRPTWGVWWTWDPRLTTTALLFILYCAYLMLRRLLDDPVRRAKIASTLGIFIFLNVPIVYFSVKWWRTLHQVQSTPDTMAPEMMLALVLNASAVLCICIFFLVVRVRLEKRQDLIEEKEAMPPEQRVRGKEKVERGIR
jgi:heme exporter protein C